MTDKDVPRKIEKETTTMILYLNIATAFPAIIPTVFLGGLSDRHGRKVVLLIAISGSLLRAIVYIIVINFRLNIHFLFIGNALEGLSGSFGTCLMAMFSLIADITEPGPKRAVRITALEAMLAIASASGLLIAGYWVGMRGYFEPMTFATCLLGLAFIFTSLCIPETLRVENKTPFSLKIFKNCVQLYTKDTANHRRWKLIICLISFFLVISIGLSRVSLTTLYLLDAPFCWPQTKINLYYSSTVLVNWISILIFVKWCGPSMSERTPAILGCVSSVGSLILLGIAVEDVYIYASAAVGIIGDVVSPALRSMMSHQVSPVEQGILFASVGVIELSCTAIIGSAATLIYNLTIEFFSGVVFLCMAGLIFIVFVLLM
ncbi:hypothetical protein LOTGIDRAFT_129713 [Lottia gigantea]|uniref:Major facilitator superfamily (MFS) profile domain-containing protein n=1 Tax=Lottia gigantea TaxID=225164 RepID=V3ZP72_LOTGI|nr:hypothetical protein LOTGIDRAFT_129713 [Lottia gigantea]ESO86137.1 hypothetical protein LOTGIDRAFT_129713 [Lottia gigantea]